MPVFHTRTIEAILEPVAQQVSQLVILHEEAMAGKNMPDLSAPVMAVGEAVKNLVLIGKQTAQSSKDEILKREMPVAFQKVEESSTNLMQATQILRGDPASEEALKKLINGARGILSGTSTLLLTFDDAEVRKILKTCKGVLDYLQLAEMVETIPDTVAFVKNLTPGVTSMCKSVEARSKELTHQVHQVLLSKLIQDIKAHSPLLLTAIRTFVNSLQKGNVGRAEAQENRNYITVKMSDDIIEIMRVLQLKLYDEEEAEDPTAVMKIAQGKINAKMGQGKDWLSNPAADANGLGERAIRDVINQARAVGAISGDPQIQQLCDDLDSLMNELSALRAKGQGSSPRALELAQQISGKLDHLSALVDNAVTRESAKGSKLPAATVAGKVRQAASWVNDPKADPNGVVHVSVIMSPIYLSAAQPRHLKPVYLSTHDPIYLTKSAHLSAGRRAMAVLAQQGRELANNLTGSERGELLRTCENIERLSRELDELRRNGKGDTPQAHEIAKQLAEELKTLDRLMHKAAINGVLVHFMDTSTALKQLEKAANAPVDQPNRERDYEEKAGAFEYAANNIVRTANQVAESGGTANRLLVDNIKSSAAEIQNLTPQLSHAGKLLLLTPGDKTASDHFNALRDQWNNKVAELTGMVDSATDTAEFVKESEEAIKKEADAALVGVTQQNPEIVLQKSGNIGRMTARVTQVASAEAENSEDPAFKTRVGTASEQLNQQIGPFVVSAKQLVMNMPDKQAQEGFKTHVVKIKDGVAEVRKAISPEVPDVSKLSLESAPPRPQPPEMAPPRPPPPVEDSIQEQELQQMEAVLAAPPADNRMAVAAHHLHSEAMKWEEEGNAIISAAKRMAILFAKMSKFISDEEYIKTHSKKELIDTARLIVHTSQEVVAQAEAVAARCVDKRLKQNLKQTVERIPTIGTQLKILATVKATLFGAKDAEADQDATEMLVGCAENLMSAVRQTVQETEAASVKIRSDAGRTIQFRVHHK